VEPVGSVVSGGVGVPPGVVAGAEGVGRPSAEEDGSGSGAGLLVVTPGFDFLVADVLGPGLLDAPVAEGEAETEAEAVGTGPGEGVVPSVAVATAPGAVAPGAPDGFTGRAGRGEVSARPAGVSSSWPGTGSQGAFELPDRSVLTITTA
jgi:hypothetical protein